MASVREGPPKPRSSRSTLERHRPYGTNGGRSAIGVNAAAKVYFGQTGT